MGVIGSVIVDLEASSAKFEGGVGKAGHALDDLGHKSEETGGLLSKIFEGAGIGAGMELFHSAFEGVSESLSKGVELIEEWVGETTKMIDQNFRLASSLGITSTAMQELDAAGFAQGIASDAVASNLEKLEKNLGEVAAGGGKEAAAALKSLGLDFKALANEPLDQAFEDIADRISKMDNAADRASATTRLFGKSGMEILPILLEGSAGLERVRKSALDTGEALSEMDNAKIVAMGGAFRDLEGRADGVKNELTLALAPALLGIGNAALDIIPPADQMKEAFIAGVHATAEGIAYLMDGYQGLKIAVLELSKTTLDAARNFVDLDGKVHEGFEAIAKANDAALASAWAKPWATAGFDTAWKKFEEDSNSAAKNILDHKSDLNKAIDLESGARSSIGWLEEMGKQAERFGDSMRGGVHKWMDELEKAREKEIDAGKRLFEEMETPAEKYLQKMDDLHKMLNDNVISQETFNRAAAKAKDDLDKIRTEKIDRNATAQIRHFDTRTDGGNATSRNHNAKLEAEAAKANKHAEKNEYYLGEIYRYQREQNQAQQAVVDF